MPTSSVPNYVSVIRQTMYQNGSDYSTFGTKRVTTGKDPIKARDINELRDLLDVYHSHTHEYQDSVGSC